MPSSHAYLSPSGSKLWLQSPACWFTPSALPTEARKFLDTYYPPSDAAAQGTLGHEFTERLLAGTYGLDLTTTKPFRRLRRSKYYSYHLEKMAKWSAEQASALIDQYDNQDYKLYLEKRVQASSIHSELWGTSDVIVTTKDTLHIIDFKFGRLPVYATSPQLAIYAIAALDTLGGDDIKTVRMTIVQPRDWDVDTHETTPEELRQWAYDIVQPKALEAIYKTGEMRPTLESCRYCDHKVTDKTHRDMFLRAINYEEGRSVNDLDRKEIEDIAANATILKQWLDDVTRTAQALAASGAEFEKVKLVNGARRRSFKNERRAIKRLKKMGFTDSEILTAPKLKPLTEIEALTGKERFSQLEKFIQVTENRPRLVASSSKEKAINNTNEIAKEFGL